MVMPKLGLTMTEGTVVKWLKAEGDSVAVGDTVYDVETDKLTNTVEATVEGTLLKILVEAGQTVDCLVPVAIIGQAGEDISALLAAKPQAQAAPAPQVAAAAPAKEERAAVAAGSGGRVIASPAAKKLAKEKGVDLTTVTGTGPNGRITTDDVELSLTAASADPKASGLAKKVAAQTGVDLKDIKADGRIMAADVYAASAGQATDVTAEETIVPMSGMRKVIARRMRESKDISPTVAFNITFDTTGLKAFRADLASEGYKASYTDLLAFAVSRLLIDHPLLNCRVDGDAIVYRNYVNLGIAVALDDGLLVPVINNAHNKSLKEISAAIKDNAEAARSNKLSLDLLSGGTFSITNLGMFGIESFTPIINQPEVAILGVNAIQETPVVIDGEVVIRPLMRLSLVADHRVVDGSVAAAFLSKLKTTLEKPALLLY
jgi:pyruvate dehydrogenase E2 component (dihydrolipoamide acetyltransferase)